ncbi:hypothetical protein [Cohnella panacarvi]|uniref:hypothetical protein n=1 Tax=Cohnella panacarvi TaxID=400776 RepID=UPI00047BCDE5|nr:hypothetical protein [Cohnella panacarvi]
MQKTLFMLTAKWIAATTLFATIFVPYATFAAPSGQSANTVTLVVRSSEHASFESLHDISRFNPDWVLRAERGKKTEFAPELTDLYVRVAGPAENRTYRMTRSGRLWEGNTGEQMVLPASASARLLKEGEVLRERHYGRLLHWREADRIFYRKCVFTVQDVETGLTFQVQRRAGRDHADVQPLTRQDTKVMNSIYGGQWSWKRRAIVVRLGDERVAASMNGKPHGGDGIPDNDFSGHFCIHFLESTTHKSTVPDVAHQMMVYKAAGQSRAFTSAASPERLAESLVHAMNERDPEWVRLLTEGVKLVNQDEVLRIMDTLAAVRSAAPRRQDAADEEDALVTPLAWSVDMYPSEEGRRSATWNMRYIRTSFFSSWQLNDILIEPGNVRDRRHKK